MRRDRVDWVDRLLSRRDNVNLLIGWIVHDLAEVFLNEDAADPLWDFIYGAADAAGAFAEFQVAVETLFRPVLALPAQEWRVAAREAARLLSSELPLAEVFPEAARKVAAGAERTEDVPPEPRPIGPKEVLLKMLERLRAAAKAMCEPTYPFTPLPAVKVFDLGGVLVWPDGPEGERPSVPDVFLTLRDELGKRYRLDDEVPRFIVDQPIVEYAIQENLEALLDRLGEAVMWCWNRRWLRWKEAGDICRQEESALEALRRELREARNSDETPTPVAALREPLRQLVEKRLEEIGAASGGSEWGEEELVPGVVWPGGELVLSGGRQYRLGDSKDRILLATQLLGHPDVGWRPEGIVRILKRLARIRERLSFIRYGWTGG